MRVYHQFTLPFPPSPPPPHLAITGSTLLPTQASSDLASQTIRNKNQRTAMSHPALVLLGLVVTGALVLSVRHAALVIASHGGQSSTSGQSEGEANSGTGGAAGGTSSMVVRENEALVLIVVLGLMLLGVWLVPAGAVVVGMGPVASLILTRGYQATSGQSAVREYEAPGATSGASMIPRVFTVQVRKYEAVVPRVALVALAVVLAGAVAAGVRH
ncbi:unnamed protein product [Closterium sp. NIES-64]|nr:unnamed protein product [Closterium sp. NIES-64]